MKHLKYAKYLFLHKWFVFLECCKLGIPLRGLFHDLSKLRPSEWGPYARHFYGSGDKTFDCAWLFHQHRNPHHWQYWVLRKDNGSVKVLDMPLKYRKEMLADWTGAGRAISGEKSPRKWYLTKCVRIQLHPSTRRWLEKQLGIKP